jgi:hypothetical protein
MDACTDSCLGCALMGLAVAAALGVLAVLARSILSIVADAQREDAPGTVAPGELALVVAPIRPRGTGEICLHGPGGPRFASARSEDAQELEKGTAVVVERYWRGIAHVRPARVSAVGEHADSNES